MELNQVTGAISNVHGFPNISLLLWFLAGHVDEDLLQDLHLAVGLRGSDDTNIQGLEAG